MVSGETLISKTSAQPAVDGKDPVLRMIAIFKFFKATTLVALSLGAFRLLHKDVGALLEHWIEALKLDPGNHFVDALLAKASNLTPEQIKKLGLGSLVYAGLFLVEGTGLWLGKRWGEWLTVIITASLVPVEIYEIVLHPTLTKVALLAVNVAIVWYLIGRVRTKATPPHR
jgi:uncharacterized membrane protein (DUF2068 family)